jgi:hypothetical protein
MRITNPPTASSLMATARSFGNYDLAAALADLIDNSIQAKAEKISIEFIPEENDVTARIRDDGNGMSREELIAAMRPASSHPDKKRDKSDLGRFGWGLKSASLSQARILTVVSWKKDSIYAARWNIDDLDDWSMDIFEGEEASKLLDTTPEKASGTEIIWTNSDHLFDFKSNTSIDERLNEKITYAKKQLSLVFHRYLVGEGSRKLEIFMQGAQLFLIDPFMKSHPATQTMDEEIIRMGDDSEIVFQAFILPHFSKLSTQEKTLLGGDEGMVRNQGFYVYRNKRLIIHGTWFRLIPHGELSQLARVRIDLPNSLDAEWKISIDKSDVQMPVVIKKRLREVISKFSRKSTGVHRHKGIDLHKMGREPVWKRNAHNGRIRYLINRDHPIIEELLIEQHEVESVACDTLKLIESFFPIDNLVKDSSDGKEGIVQSITDPAEYDSLIQACFVSYMHKTDKPPSLSDFMAFIKNVEPFASQWKYTESFVRENVVKKWKLKSA